MRIPVLAPAGAARIAEAAFARPPAEAMPRRLAVVVMLLAALAVAASLMMWLPLPSDLAAVANGSIGPLALRQAAPLIAAMLGLLGGVLALAAGGRAGQAAVEPSTVLGLQTVVRELRGILQDERAELAALRDTCGEAAQESMRVGARLAGVAMDAETRLAAGVALAEQSWSQPAAERARLAEVADRLERASVRDGVAEPIEAATRTLTEATARVIEQIEAVGGVAGLLRRDATSLDAAGREIATAGAGLVARLADAATQLRDEGQVLFEARVEATHGAMQSALQAAAATIQEAAEAAASRLAGELARTEAALEREALVHGAAKHAVHELADIAAALGREAASLYEGAAMATRGLGDAGEAVVARISSVADKAEWALAGVAALPSLTTSLTAAAAALRQDAGAMDESGRRTTASVESAVIRLDDHMAAASATLDGASARAASMHATAEGLGAAGAALVRVAKTAADDFSRMAAQAGADVARQSEDARRELADTGRGLEECAAGLRREATAALAVVDAGAGAVSRAAEAAREVIEGTASHAQAAVASLAGVPAMTDAVRAAAGSLGDQTTALRTTAAMIEAAADGLGGRLADEAATIRQAGRAIPEAAALLSATCAQVVQTLSEASSVLCADGAALDASGRETLQAASLLRREAEDLVAAGHSVSGGAADVVARLSDVAARIAANTAAAGAAVAAIETMPRLGADLAETAAGLRLDADQLAAAGRDVAAAAGLTIAAGRELPELALGLRAAAEGLRQESGVVTATARLLGADSVTVFARLDSSVTGLEAVGRAVAGASDQLTDQLGRLDGGVERLRQTAADAAAEPTDGPWTAGAPRPLVATLRHLDAVEREAGGLLREATALAGAVLGGQAEALPLLLASRTPALLAGVDATIHRLRSAATALALASDGPDVLARAASRPGLLAARPA